MPITSHFMPVDGERIQLDIVAKPNYRSDEDIKILDK